MLILLPQLGHGQDKVFRTYGYFDLEYEISDKDAKSKRGTFDQHHFNIISSYILDENFRVLGEVEWEHGFDFKGNSGVGELRLERAWVEYKHTEGFKIRAGKFLTPYGIYNLIHDATPTFLSTFLPNSVYGKHLNPLGEKQRLYAKFGTGLQVLGTIFPGAWQLEYTFFLSNGQGEKPHHQDDNANKAFGSRILLGFPAIDFNLGTSFYSEKNGAAGHTHQQNLAFDGTLTLNNLQLQSEIAFSKLESVDDGGQPNGSYLNTTALYGQLAYTIAERWTPFIRQEIYGTDKEIMAGNEYRTVAGLNLSVTPYVYLKAETHLVHEPEVEDYAIFVASIAVAF